MTIETKIKRALRALPYNADRIAVYLLRRGFKGKPGKPCACPVANYLQKAVGPEYDVHVYGDHLDVWRDGLLSAELRVRPSISKFIRTFDLLATDCDPEYASYVALRER